MSGAVSCFLTDTGFIAFVVSIGRPAPSSECSVLCSPLTSVLQFWQQCRVDAVVIDRWYNWSLVVWAFVLLLLLLLLVESTISLLKVPTSRQALSYSESMKTWRHFCKQVFKQYQLTGSLASRSLKVVSLFVLVKVLVYLHIVNINVHHGKNWRTRHSSLLNPLLQTFRDF